MIATVSAGSYDAWPMWLPMAMMVVGVVLLGLLSVLLIGERGALRDEDSQILTRFEPQPAIQPPIAAVIDAFETCARELRTRNLRLHESLAKLEQRVREVESRSLIDNSARSNGKGAVVATEIKPPRSNALHEQMQYSPLLRSIFELADAGQSSVQIARQLNEHVGTVELVLALRTM